MAMNNNIDMIFFHNSQVGLRLQRRGRAEQRVAGLRLPDQVPGGRLVPSYPQPRAQEAYDLACRGVVTGLVGPFLTGVYAGDEEQLGARAVFGQLVELEQRFGSLTAGALLGSLGRRRPRGLRGSYSTQEGLGPFARRLADRLGG